ncbi:hypothetical protein GGF31_003465 [Allomyces arbusculus]|nr:hypothetical protein GGF31_003465 [Allomyces arbusculus]
MVERFNKTIKSMYYKYYEATRDNNWPEALQKLVENYNETGKRQFGFIHTPNSLYEFDNIENAVMARASVKNENMMTKHINRQKMKEQQDKPIDIGAWVRVIVKRKAKTKGEPKWSLDVNLNPAAKGLDKVKVKVKGEDGKEKEVLVNEVEKGRFNSTLLQVIPKVIERECDRGVFNITCGGGKSRIIKEAALLYKISVVFAPTKNLVSQFYRDYFEGDQNFVPVVINSDNPVDETTVESVKEALGTDARIVFLCNYQSLHVVQHLCVDLGVVIDIVMFDEAHNVTSKNSRGKITDMKVEQNSGSDDMDVDSDYESENSDDDSDSVSESSLDHVYQVDAVQVAKLQARKTFFFTATPTRVMKNYPDIYGDELIRYTYAQAVMDGVVKNVDTVIECYAADDKSCLDAGYDRLIPAINRFIADAGVSRVIVYTSHVRGTSSSKASVDGLVKNKKLFDKNIVVHAVTASTTLQQRDKIFDTFRDKSKNVHVIVSCRTISEGVDLPNCDAVVILDPSRSVVTNVQRGLRACRLTPEERRRGTWDNAVVFYPINVPRQAFVELVESTHDSNAKDYLSKSIHAHSFEFAMTVVNFLKNDLELDVLFDFKCPGSSGNGPDRNTCEIQLRQEPASKPGKPVSRVTFSLDTYVNWDVDQFRKSATYLSTSMNVIGFDEMWARKYQKVREFMNLYGRAPSKHAKTEDEKVLGLWVRNRRHEHSKGKLSQDRVSQLESILEWSWDPFQDSYNKNLMAVRDFMTLYGRAPSQTAKTKDEKVLGSWASGRRAEYSKEPDGYT